MTHTYPLPMEPADHWLPFLMQEYVTYAGIREGIIRHTD
jgi:hypothetical protein